MACSRIRVFAHHKVLQPYFKQSIASFKRVVRPVNTYYRFKKKNDVVVQPQQFNYFLVLDFEATCDNRSEFSEMLQEIVEFPCLKVDAATFETLDVFHSYVRPTKHPTITSFCTDLTGITQDIVDNAAPFPEVLDHFLKWLRNGGIEFEGSRPNSAFVTSGDWDLLTMLPRQCYLSNIPVPSSMNSWINIKKAFVRSTGLYPYGIKDMLSQLQLEHEGRLHSGIDDCKNIVKIMKSIAERGHIFQISKTRT